MPPPGCTGGRQENGAFIEAPFFWLPHLIEI